MIYLLVWQVKGFNIKFSDGLTDALTDGLTDGRTVQKYDASLRGHKNRCLKMSKLLHPLSGIVNKPEKTSSKLEKTFYQVHSLVAFNFILDFVHSSISKRAIIHNVSICFLMNLVILVKIGYFCILVIPRLHCTSSWHISYFPCKSSHYGIGLFSCGICLFSSCK